MASFAMSMSALPKHMLPRLVPSSTAVRPAFAATTSANRWQQARRNYRTQPIVYKALRMREEYAAPTQPSTAAIRHFSATARQLRDHHFDTLKFVQRLKDDGFTEEQAVAMMKVLSDVIEERYGMTQVLSAYSH